MTPTDENRIDPFWSATISDTPVGPVSILVSEKGLAVVEFASADDFALMLRVPVEKTRPAPDVMGIALRQISDYFTGKRKEFTIPLDLDGITSFSREVLVTASQIPYGRVRTYGSLAAAAGHAGASRAVGGVMSRNPLPVVIPCHRVVASDGSLHGYSGPGGLQTKTWLLALEGHRVENFRLKGKTWSE